MRNRLKLALKLCRAWRRRFCAAFDTVKELTEQVEHQSREIERVWGVARDRGLELTQIFEAIGPKLMSDYKGDAVEAVRFLHDGYYRDVTRLNGEIAKLRAEVHEHEDRQTLVWQLGREMRAEIQQTERSTTVGSQRVARMLTRLHDHYREALLPGEGGAL